MRKQRHSSYGAYRIVLYIQERLRKAVKTNRPFRKKPLASKWRAKGSLKKGRRRRGAAVTTTAAVMAALLLHSGCFTHGCCLKTPLLQSICGYFPNAHCSPPDVRGNGKDSRSL